MEQAAPGEIGTERVSAAVGDDDASPVAIKAPEFPPLVDQAFDSYASERVQPLPPLPLYSELSKASPGQRINLPFPGFSMAGRLHDRVTEGSLVHYGVDLEDVPGRFVLTMSQEGRALGRLLFNGESRAFLIKGDRFSDWKIEATTVSAIFCAPIDATYPLTGNAGFLAVNDNQRESIAVAAGSFNQIALSSLPSSDYVIYIDFDGETVTSPSWNGGATIVAEPHPQAANDSWVTVVWQRVAEDFVPFNINVTTDRSVFNSADVDKRVMCVVTPTSTAAPFAGGVAILESFGLGIPCWTFNLSEYACADTISHEVGHTLDLVHDGQAGDDDQYFDGHGAGETGWGSIMGAPFEGGNENVTQWSIGEYANAVNYFTNTSSPNTQDDIAVIAANGFGIRPDDNTDTANPLAESLDIFGSIVSDDGFIETAGDIDFFSFSTVGGAVQISAAPLDVDSQEGEDGSDTLGGNLAMELVLYDDGGTPILSDNPTTTLGASISTVLAEGDYYLSVQGVGRNDPETDGFSDYGSLGQFFLTGIVASGPLSVLGGPAFDVLIADGDGTPAADDGTSFGLIAVGTPGGISKTFRLENTLDSELTISGISFDGTQFASDLFAPLVIPALSTVDLTITFNPSDVGIVVDTLTLDYFETTVPGTTFSYSFSVQGVVTKTANDDNYEENDNFFEAFPLPGETRLVNILGDGRQADNDWYQINVAPGFNSVTVTCEFDSIEGDINLALYDTNGYFLTASEALGDVETLNFVVNDDGGAHYIRVYGEGNANTYDLFWEGLSPLLPVAAAEDNYEDNNDFQSAVNIGSIKGDTLSSLDGEGTQLDDDWYELPFDPGEPEITVTLTNTGTAGLVYFELYQKVNGRGPFLVEAVETNGSFETLTHTGPRGTSSYMVRVYGDDAGTTYELAYDDAPSSVVVAGDDNYESNNNFFKSFDLTGSGSVPLVSVDGLGVQLNPDWYKIQSLDGENVIQVTLDAYTAAPDSANFSVSIYDWRGYQVTTATSPVVDEVFLVRAPLGLTDYYVLVNGDDLGDTYSFTWGSRFVPEDDDIYEDNDTLETAFDIKNRESERLSRVSEPGIQSDDDWFEIQLFAGDGAIRASLEFIHADGNIDIGLYDAAGVLLGEATSNTDNEALGVELPPAAADQSYFLLVSGADSGNTYDLSWSSTLDLNDDNYEENDFFDEAYILPSENTGLLSDIDGLGVQADSDYYQLAIPADATALQLALTFTDEEGDIDIALFDQDQELLQASISITDNEFIQVPAATFAGESVFIWIYFANAGNEYDLEWTITVPDSGSVDSDADLISDEWEDLFFGSLSSASGSSNADGDEFADWLEYALNLDPLAADSAVLAPYVEGGYMKVRFSRSKKAVAAGYRYNVLQSTDLDFTSASEAVLDDVIDMGDYEDVIYRSAEEVSDVSSSFFRLQVQKPVN